MTAGRYATRRKHQFQAVDGLGDLPETELWCFKAALTS